jgi:hypothetical protein
MNGRLMHKMATNPVLLAKVLATGRMPVAVKVTSPLIEFLEKMPARDRRRVRGIRPSWKLGYLTRAKFHNGEALLRWLKPFDMALESENWPADGCRVKAFRTPIKMSDFLECCDVFPDEMSSLREMVKKGIRHEDGQSERS